jgi:pantoate--beta-alanine ligase
MVKQLGSPVLIKQLPIVREASGLALSSRNMRLTPEQRNEAVAISRALFASKETIDELTVDETRQAVIAAVDAVPSLTTEYFEIVDGDTMQPIASWGDTDYAVGCITVWCGDVRLIDNIIYKGAR